MSGQTEHVFDTDELEQLKASNLLKDFVNGQDGHWDHFQWEAFLASVRSLGYSLPTEVIGAELEMEKTYYWKVRNGEIVVPDSEPVPEAVVMDEKHLEEKHEPFDPIRELENSVIVEDDSAHEDGADTYLDVVDFESLSREERSEYLKNQMKKKLGEG